MKIAIPIISSGRYDYLDKTLESFRNNINPQGHEFIFLLHQDRTIYYNEAKTKYILEKYNFNGYIITDTNLGPIASVRNAWENLPECDYVWHQEEDFIFLEKINIDDFIKVLENDTISISQLLLERDNGNNPSIKKSYKFINASVSGVEFCYCPTHFFSTNPHLIKKSEVDKLLKNCKTSEYDMAVYYHEQGYFGAYLGYSDVPNKVAHIGIERIGNYSEY